MRNIILATFQIFAFSHKLGHSRPGLTNSKCSHVRFAPKATDNRLGATRRDGPIATETGTTIIWSDANRQHATATKFLPVQYEIDGR